MISMLEALTSDEIDTLAMAWGQNKHLSIQEPDRYWYDRNRKNKNKRVELRMNSFGHQIERGDRGRIEEMKLVSLMNAYAEIKKQLM